MARLTIRASLVLSLALAAAAAPARAQADSTRSPDEHHGHHEHDEHGALHFSHPLQTESPSPDTKLRLDYAASWAGHGASALTEHAVRVEGEYAFSPALSLAVTVPYVALRGALHASGVGNTELSLKAASLRWGARGVLVGGGMELGLPTGSSAVTLEEGSPLELSPFADVAWKRGGLEVVAFGYYGTTVNNPEGAEAERTLNLDGSVLYPVSHAIEALVEVGTVHHLAGDLTGSSSAIAPGLKLYPFTNRSLMFGVSVPIGMSGEMRDVRGLMVSAFYHF